jgi:hypothetical protein
MAFLSAVHLHHCKFILHPPSRAALTMLKRVSSVGLRARRPGPLRCVNARPFGRATT